MNELLLIIDVQNDFNKMISQSFENSLEKLLKYTTIINKNYIFIKSHYFETDPNEVYNNRLEGTHTGSKICIKNTHGSNIINSLSPYSNTNNTIIKNYYSAFKNTELHAQLQLKNINTLVFIGLTINTCIKATIHDALLLGYNVKIIEECVTSSNTKMKTKGLNEIQEMSNNIQIISLEEYTNGFEIICENDVYLINDVFPPSIYTEETFNKLVEECQWKSMKINGGTLSRDIDVQAINKDNMTPVYRNPSDEYIYPNPPTPTIEKMFNWLNNNINIQQKQFNHVFIKYYKSCADGIGKHSDKTLDLDKNSFIGNYSIGSTRKMKFTSKTTKEIVEITLKSNSILFIGMETNKKWFHEVKPDGRPIKEKTTDELSYNTQRMSLTFRTACTFMDNTSNKLFGQGAPTTDNMDDRIELIKAFSNENKLADFDWNEHYGYGFYSLNT